MERREEGEGGGRGTSYCADAYLWVGSAVALEDWLPVQEFPIARDQLSERAFKSR